MNRIAQRLATVTIGEPAQHRNLAVFPLIGARQGRVEYLRLDEALAKALLRIAEEGPGGRVPEVAVHNEAPVPVLLVEGEELVGCQQNRVINVSILVPPRSHLVIPVSCVEQGRWKPTSAAFEAAEHSQFSKARAAKVASVSASLAAGAGYRSDQAGVWARIHDKAEALKAASATMAMADIYRQASSSLAEFERCLPKSDDALGAAFCIGETVAGIDLFDQPGSWAKYGPKLLKGYALDALDAPQPQSGGPTLSAPAFIDRLGAARFAARPALGMGEDLRADLPDITAAALVADATVVHLCAFTKGHDLAADRNVRSRLLRRRGAVGGMPPTEPGD